MTLIDKITKDVSQQFRCFGVGSRGNAYNPLHSWLKDASPQFALGVDVKEVVEFILKKGECMAKKVWVQRSGSSWVLEKSQGIYPEVEAWSEVEFRQFLVAHPDVEPVLKYVEPDKD